jgi:hypothetical protein
MSGGLDDALARMDRWEALRQRIAGPALDRTEPVVDEIIEAIGTVLRRHAPHTITVTIEAADHTTSARIGWHDGRLTVEPGVAPVSDGRPGGEPSASQAGQAGAGQAGTGRFASSGDDGRLNGEPSAGRGDDSWQSGEPSAGRGGDGRLGEGGLTIDRFTGPDADGRFSIDRSGSRGGTRPSEPETLDQTAARLAELIRQDPSLLHGDGMSD